MRAHTHFFELRSCPKIVSKMKGTLAVWCEHTGVPLCECAMSPGCQVTCVREKEEEEEEEEEEFRRTQLRLGIGVF